MSSHPVPWYLSCPSPISLYLRPGVGLSLVADVLWSRACLGLSTLIVTVLSIEIIIDVVALFGIEISIDRARCAKALLVLSTHEGGLDPSVSRPACSIGCPLSTSTFLPGTEEAWMGL